MMALTLQQPWASWVLGIAPVQACGALPGVRDCENRGFSVGHRGDILIHSARSVCKPAMNMYWGMEDPPGFPRGALLGVVRLVEILPPEARCVSRFAELGKYHWMLSYPRPFAEPFPYCGRQGLYPVHGAEVRAAVERAEYDARRLWRSLPVHDREDLLERAAVSEDMGMSRRDANVLAIKEFQRNRALRAGGMERNHHGTVDS